VKLKSALAFVWRYSLADGIYNPGGLIIVKDAGYNNHRFVGTQVQQTVAWSLNRYVSLRGIYGHFFAGSYLRNSKPERLDTDFFTALLSFIF
ncbi:MAG: alginate export family protein, partial [Rhizobacter sp.]|nr:alginate export family protein [Ferruginibacter sp.]